VRRSLVFIDTDAALAEAGDIIQSLQAGVIGRHDILGTLYSLCRGEVQGRRDAADITLFKSVGSAIEDLAAASLVMASLGTEP
jgi:ornithine cyclodeaminase/alanine dehydrogenase-like protein (mu-crystallin family)